MNNQAANRLVTIGATTTELDGEANLTFDGSTFNISGDVRVTDTNASQTSSPTLSLRANDNGTNDGAVLRFDKSGPIATGENLGEIYWYGGNAAGNAYYSAAAIIAEGDSAWSDGVDHSTRIKFATTSGASSPTEHFVLDSSGNVGIGTMSPTHRLHVDGAVSASSNISASAFYGDGSNLTNVSAGISYSRRAVSTNITASINDTILGVSGTAAIDIRLPSAGDYSAGQYFTVKDESGAANLKNITVLTSGSQTIDGATSIILESPFAAVNIYSDGTSKFFIY